MSPRSRRELLDLAAQQQVEGIDLTARIVSLTPGSSPTRGEGRKPSPLIPLPQGEREVRLTPKGERALLWMQRVRARPVFIVLLLIISLALISGAAYALSRSLGYLPGVGLIEQGSPLRMLAKPLSQTRDGITLSVREAILTSERTVIVMTIENVPWHAFANQEDSSVCYAEPQLSLPNGELLGITAGRASSDAEGHLELRWTYAPIPPQVNEADFLVPCLQGALFGKAPENWLFKLRFVPAPPELTVLPVQEVATPLPPTPSQPDSQTPEGWRLEKVIETEQGYIFVGAFHLSNLPYHARVLGFGEWPSVTDAFGNPIPAYAASDLDLSSAVPGAIPWSIEIRSKQVAWPITIRVQSLDAETTDLTAEFIVDVGSNPQPGQEWAVSQTIQLGELQFKVQRVRFTGQGYEFEIKATDPLRHIQLAIEGATSSGGFGSSDNQGNVQVGLEFETPPTGQLRVRISGIIFRVPGDWSFQWKPEEAQSSQSLFGIRLVLDKTVELEDGTYLVGHLEWDDERIQSASPTGWLYATDAQGRRLALEQASFDVFSQLLPKFSEADWVYFLQGKAFAGPITLHLENVNLMLRSPLRLSLDLRAFNFEFDRAQNGQSYPMGLSPLSDLPDLKARLARISYLRQGKLHGFDLYFEADPRLSGISMQLAEGLIPGTGEGKFLIGSYQDEASGLLVARVLSDAQMTMPLALESFDIQVRGNWVVEWNPPPAPSGSTPFYAAQACLTLEKWKQALQQRRELPDDLPGEILLRGESPEPAAPISLARLDGSISKELVFAQAASLSPDGEKLVYADLHHQLMLLDLNSGQLTPITQGNTDTTPFWSPDGKQIAFVRMNPQGFQLFLVGMDGLLSQGLIDETGSLSLWGWTPDGKQLVFSQGSSIKTLDLLSGEVVPLIETRLRDYWGGLAFSSAGWIAYLDQAAGWKTPGLYINHDPSQEVRLLVQLDNWFVSEPRFSPNGRWLAFSVMNADLPHTPVVPGLINIENCQVIPLPALTGTILGWR